MNNVLKMISLNLILLTGNAVYAQALVAAKDWTPIKVNSQVENNVYVPLVKTGYNNYKSNYLPSAIPNSNGEVVLNTAHSGVLNKVKIFIPPGTTKLSISVQNYSSPEEAKAAAKFMEIPMSNKNDVTPNANGVDTRKTLSRLFNKEELQFYSPGGSGALSIANSESTDTFKATYGGYIYLNFLSLPGGKILSLQTRVTVDQNCYSNWFNKANWDQNGNPTEFDSHECEGIINSDNNGMPTQEQTRLMTLKNGVKGFVSENSNNPQKIFVELKRNNLSLEDVAFILDTDAASIDKYFKNAGIVYDEKYKATVVNGTSTANSNVVTKPSDEAIKLFVQKNVNSPKTIHEAAKIYGLNSADIAKAIGYNEEQVNTYFKNANLPLLKPSDVAIKNFVVENLNNPKIVYTAAKNYGLTVEDLAKATSSSREQIIDYFGKSGLKL